MQTKIVASALAEILKILGALGILNMATLSLISGSKLQLTGTFQRDGSVTLDGLSITYIRPLTLPEWDTIICGVALIMVFARFFYGSIILLQGEYIEIKSPPVQIRLFDFFPVLIFLPLFSLMSFYGGVGNIKTFSCLLFGILIIDASAMWLSTKHSGRYLSQRQAWSKINGLTALLFLLGYFVYSQVWHVVEDILVFYSIILIYYIASVADLVCNFRFYFGRLREDDHGDQHAASS